MSEEWRPPGVLGDLLPGELNDACCWACSGVSLARVWHICSGARVLLLESSTTVKRQVQYTIASIDPEYLHR